MRIQERHTRNQRHHDFHKNDLRNTNSNGIINSGANEYAQIHTSWIRWFRAFTGRSTGITGSYH